jgi:hypothetical protein
MSKRIKDVLVNLAINDNLPTDMTELDEHIFEEALKLNMTDIEAKAEKHALGQYLSEYPEDMEYNEILERIGSGNLEDKDGDIIIVLWEPFEDRDTSSVVEDINNTKDSTLDLLIEVFNG